MEDKTFELLEKMYTEMQQGFKAVNERIDNVEGEVKKIGATIDGDIKPKVEALFDGYKANTEKLELLADKVDDLQISVNNLSIKTTSNDNKIIELSRNLKSSVFKKNI